MRPASAQSGEEWSKTFGGENSDEAHSLVQTSEGGYALAGQTSSFGTGHGGFWLVKTDSQGNEEWSKTFGGEDDAAFSLIQTGDGGYALAGRTYSFGSGGDDFWLVKTNSQGNKEWSKTFGGEDSDEARSLIQTSDGGFALTGSTNSFGAGSRDFWLVKTDSQGNEEWSKTFGGENWDRADSLVQTSDNGFALGGWTRSFGPSEIDSWLVKTDSQGNEEWSRTFGGEGSDSAGSLIQTGDGGYALAGATNSFGLSRSDFWLVKTDSQGNKEWSRTFGGEGIDSARSLVRTSDGGYALAGRNYSFGSSWYDFWLVKTDNQGKEEWSKTFGGDKANSLVQTSDGGYAVTGRTYSSGSGFNAWLVKVKAWYEPRSELSASIEPGESGSVLLNPSGGVYEGGENVTVTAEPGEGYEFDHWSGDVPPVKENEKSITIRMDSDKSLTANFTLKQYDLSTSVGSGNGSVSLSPSGGTYDAGTTVAVTAPPDSHYKFDHWSGDVPRGKEGEKSITITMDSNKELTAHFTEAGGGPPLLWIGLGVAVIVGITIALIVKTRT